MLSEFDEKTSRNFLAPAPAIIGPEIKKANLADSWRERLRKRPAEIVEPDHEG